MPVKFKVASGKGSIEGNTLTVKEAGEVEVIAYQEGDKTYWSAEEVSHTICVIPSVPTISVYQAEHGVYLTSSSSVGNQWYLDNQKLSGETNDTVFVKQSGSYSVLTSAGDCSNTSKVVSVTGDEELSLKEDKLRVFPNPFSGSFNVAFSSKINEKKEWILVNSIGVEVKSGNLQQIEQVWSGEIVGKNLPSGIYKLVLTDSGSNYVKSIIKD